jgi:hypothetical protein
MTDAPTVVFLVDAFRHDFLSEELTPRLAGLARQGVRRPLVPILGYSDAIRATFFTGRYPDETGYWMEYCYRPTTSPWKAVAPFGSLDGLRSERVLRATRYAVSAAAVRGIAEPAGFPRISLRNIPFKALDRFDLTLHEPMTAPGALGCPSVFDECTSTGRPWAYLDASTVRRGTELLEQVDALPSDVGLVFVYLHQVDMAAHLLGLRSRLFWRRVRSTDELVGGILDRVRRRFGAVEPIVFSDHGMSELRGQAGLQDLLAHDGFPNRFFLALDATMVRLWFLDDDERLRAEVLDRVAARFPGRFLTSEDRARYHLSFEGRLYGDEIFLLPPGQAIFPNFHSFVRPRAMHAYEPTDPDQWGITIAPASAAERLSELVDLAELTTLVREGLGAPVPVS